MALLLSATVFSPALGGWHNVLFVFAGLCLLLGLVWLSTARDKIPEPSSAPAPGRGSALNVFVALLKKRQVLVLCSLYLLFLGSYQGWAGSIPFLLENVLAWSKASAHGMVSLVLCCYVVGALTIPSISDWVGLRRPIMSAGFLVCGVSGFAAMLLAALVPSHPLIWILMAMVGLFAGVIPLAFAITLESPDIGMKRAGTAVGIVLTAGNLGGFIFPFLNGLISGSAPGVPQMISIVFLCFIIGYGGAGTVTWLLKETGPKRQSASKP